MSYGEPAKPGRNTVTRNEVSAGSTKLDIVQQSPSPQGEAENLVQKARAPTDAIVELVEQRFLWKKSRAPMTIIYRHANIFLLVFCWRNADRVCLQPGKEKLPAGSRKAEINLVSHR